MNKKQKYLETTKTNIQKKEPTFPSFVLQDLKTKKLHITWSTYEMHLSQLRQVLRKSSCFILFYYSEGIYDVHLIERNPDMTTLFSRLVVRIIESVVLYLSLDGQV